MITIAPRDRLATLVVLAVWALMLGTALASIARWGRDVPLAEDWHMVGPLTGNEPDMLAWTVAQNNEHRAPLPRLVQLATLHLTGGDFRAGMVVNALVLGLATLALIGAARRLRGGRSAWPDLFFPVLFLHLGNWENIVWGWQLAFTISTALTCLLLVAVVCAGERLEARLAWLAAVVLALLPVTGANGLIYALGLAPWAAWAGWRTRTGARTPTERRAGTALVAAAPVAVLLVALYFRNYQEATWNPPSPGHGETLWTAARVLALAWGPVAREAWWPAVLATIALLAPTALLVLLAAWRALRRGGLRPTPVAAGTAPDTRIRDWGLLCFASAALLLVLSIGWGRAGSVAQFGIPTRYAMLAAPALCMAWFAWQLHAPALGRRLVQWGLALAMLVLLVPNTRQGFGWRDWYLRGARAVEQDVARGATAAEIAATHRQFLLHWNERYLRDRLEMLRLARIGPFAALRAGELDR